MSQWILAASAVILLLASGYFSYLYLVQRITNALGEQKRFFAWQFDKKLACVMGITSILSLGIFWYSWCFKNHLFIPSYMNAQVFLYLVLLGYIDLREKIIPNELIGIGLAFWLVLTLVDIFVAKSYWLSVLKISLVGGLLVGGVMFIIALIVRTALGMGDVKMFFVLGLLYGVVDTYSILLFSMIIMAVISLVLLAIKKVNTKTAIPMAPFVAIGFLLSIIAGM